MPKKLNFAIYQHRVSERQGTLSGAVDFVIQWKFKKIPMPWINVRTKAFGAYKVLTFTSEFEAKKAAYRSFETKKILSSVEL